MKEEEEKRKPKFHQFICSYMICLLRQPQCLYSCHATNPHISFASLVFRNYKQQSPRKPAHALMIQSNDAGDQLSIITRKKTDWSSAQVTYL